MTRLRYGALAGALSAAIAAAALLMPVRKMLTVRAQPSGELRLCAPVSDGDELVISYVHSVNRRPVDDTLRVEGEALRIVSSRFDAFGAGIPETATPGHPLVFLPDGRMEYTVDRLVDDVSLFVGRVARHTLRMGPGAVPLADLSPPGTAVRFAVERLSHLQRCRGVTNHE